jgi:hypothetical protein
MRTLPPSSDAIGDLDIGYAADDLITDDKRSGPDRECERFGHSIAPRYSFTFQLRTHRAAMFARGVLGFHICGTMRLDRALVRRVLISSRTDSAP